MKTVGLLFLSSFITALYKFTVLNCAYSLFHQRSSLFRPKSSKLDQSDQHRRFSQKSNSFRFHCQNNKYIRYYNTHIELDSQPSKEYVCVMECIRNAERFTKSTVCNHCSSASFVQLHQSIDMFAQK